MSLSSALPWNEMKIGALNIKLKKKFLADFEVSLLEDINFILFFVKNYSTSKKIVFLNKLRSPKTTQKYHII